MPDPFLARRCGDLNTIWSMYTNKPGEVRTYFEYVHRHSRKYSFQDQADMMRRSMHSEIITLEPNDSTTRFHTHIDLLKDKCPAVHQAASWNVKEGEKGLYKFEGVNKDTLGRFWVWLYRSDFTVHDGTPNTIGNILPILEGLYMFAATYLIDKLKAYVELRIRVFLCMKGCSPEPPIVRQAIGLFRLAFDNLEPEDSFQRVLARYAAHEISYYKSEPSFVALLPKMAPLLVEYLEPYSGEI